MERAARPSGQFSPRRRSRYPCPFVFIRGSNSLRHSRAGAARGKARKGDGISLESTGTVVNAGSIAGNTTSDAGVLLLAGGSVINQSVPVRYLVNGSTIAQVKMDSVTYHHIELAEHDVLLAEGLPAESFLDMKGGSNYRDRAGPARLYPDFTARMWEAFGCTPLTQLPQFDWARRFFRDGCAV